MRDSRRDDGFTLIELMVVVLIIAILLAIAIPTFLGARSRANDRAVQSNLRNAHTNELVYFADAHDPPFTNDVATLRELDASLDWTTNPADMVQGPRTVYVYLTTVGVQPAVVVAGRSPSGSCFWLRAVSQQDHPRFAQNDCSATPAATDFKSTW